MILFENKTVYFVSNKINIVRDINSKNINE